MPHSIPRVHRYIRHAFGFDQCLSDLFPSGGWAQRGAAADLGTALQLKGAPRDPAQPQFTRRNKPACLGEVPHLR